MILDYYRIFYYVAQYKSFSKAADVMGNNQPNITRCMNILENELGCKLFIRSNRGVQLTIEGERLFEHVSIAIEQLVSGENELLKDKGLESGLVNIGASEIALRLFLLNELEVFHHRYPHVKLRISNHSTPQAVQALENGLVDFAVVTTPVALKKPLQRIPLYSFRECMNILENELGCKLFIRSNRGVQLTIEGERLFEHVSIAIEQLVSGENELLKDKGLESGLVNIGASEIALRLFLLNELEVFHHRYPHVKLRISNHSTPQAVQALENGLVDFAVVTTPVALKKPLQRIPLYSFREILIGGEEYAETASNKHCLQDLQDIPLIGIAPGSSTRELYTQYFMRHNLPFSPDMEVATTDQIFPMVQHNLGIGFFPEELAAEHIAQGKIVQIPIEEPLPERKICLIRNVKRPQSIAARSLEEHLTSHRETE